VAKNAEINFGIALNLSLMKVDFFINDRPVQFQEGFPAGYQGTQIIGSNNFSAVTDVGTIIIQEIRTRWFTLRHQVIDWLHPANLQTHHSARGVHATIALEEMQAQTIVGTGVVDLQQGEYGAMLTNAWKAAHQWRGKGKEITLEAVCTQAFCEDIFANDPPLLEAMKRTHPGFPQLLGKPYRILSPRMSYLIEDILYCPYAEPLRTEYLKEQVQHLVTLLIREADSDQWWEDHLTDIDSTVVHSSVQLIEENRDKHFSIAQIAQVLGTTEYHLKKSFRRVMRMGLYEYLIQQRLLSIREDLLTTNKPLKALYEQANYRSEKSLITAFRKYFDCTPGDLRRNKQENKSCRWRT
jgi:AraC-like DNA-binding protein